MAQNNSTLLIAFALVVALVAVVFLGAAAIYRPSHQRTIMISASGTATASPSISRLSVTINGTGSTAAIAQHNLSVVASNLNDTLMPYLNGNASLIQTTYYSVYQPTNCTYPPIVKPVNASGDVIVYPPTYCVPTRLPYFVATESITITVPNIANTSAVLDKMSGIGSLQLQNVEADLSKSQLTTLNQNALSSALSNATSQATLLASGSSVTVLNITVQNSYFYGYPAMSVTSAAGAARDSNSSFFSGTQSVQKSIYVVYGLG